MNPPTLVAFYGRNAKRQKINTYQCGCGVQFQALEYNFQRGQQSCGCMSSSLISASKKTHGEAHPQTVEYRIWAGMKTRCFDASSASYSRYGGRGIRVCQEWSDSYDAFLAHVGRRPSSEHSLDRKDNEKHYEPGNVRWATRSEQARNRRSTRLLTHGGKTQCLEAWADEIGICQSSLVERLQQWPEELALTTPPNGRKMVTRKLVAALANAQAFSA